jgi:hypothetical protein
MKLNLNQLQGILRHLFTFGGGLLVAKGHLDEESLQQISGLVISLVGVIWSVASKK